MSEKNPNPKDIAAVNRAPLHLNPDTALCEMSLAMLEGARKYGAYNWRGAPVRASVYVAAAQRHLARWWNGADRDPSSGASHLAHVMACCAIVLDAMTAGTLVDDRPPAVDIDEVLNDVARRAEVQTT